MSSNITWQEPKNRGLMLLTIGVTTIIQFIIVFTAQYYFLINSLNIFIFVSLGIICLVSGAEILIAQIIHSYRIHRRQTKPSKKKRKYKKISETISILIGIGITSGLFSLLYFLFSYNLIDPFVLTYLPIFGKFALAEMLAGIVLVILVVIFEAIIPQK